MSIIISDLAYHYPNQNNLFEHICFSVEKQDKVSIVGINGVGKSTLLKLLSGELFPSEGSIISTSPPYYIPQHTGLLGKSVADVLKVGDKLQAFHAIMKGSISQTDYDMLADDWTIEARCKSAFHFWGIPAFALDMAVDELSGGEKTKVFLAGLLIHNPEIILLDEPSNHLDAASRKLLYQYICQSTASIIVVSHDRMLLDRLDTTYELSEHGIRQYGGNYSFYAGQKEIEENALAHSLHAEEKTLRLARKKAQEVRERQEKRLHKGQKNKTEVPRIYRKTLTNSSENTSAKLKGKHAEIIENAQHKLAGLRQQQSALAALKIDFDNTSLHSGKVLVEAIEVNYGYEKGALLWEKPMNFKLLSNDRIHIRGNNGSGKTTLIKLLMGLLTPTTGEVRRADFNWIYLDQNYSLVDVDCSIVSLAESYNRNHLPEHEVKLRLNRFLFPSDTWDKNCQILSGGEKMRLYLCCLMISNQTPDLIILDEPTNNLDITNIKILTQTIKNYQGSLLVICHDKHFVDEIGITGCMEI